jgi:hypothetical protein
MRPTALTSDAGSPLAPSRIRKHVAIGRTNEVFLKNDTRNHLMRLYLAMGVTWNIALWYQGIYIPHPVTRKQRRTRENLDYYVLHHLHPIYANYKNSTNEFPCSRDYLRWKGLYKISKKLVATWKFPLNKASTTYGTHAKRGTRNDFQWHDEWIEIQ